MMLIFCYIYFFHHGILLPKTNYKRTEQFQSFDIHVGQKTDFFIKAKSTKDRYRNVTTEPAQSGPTLFNKILSCFAEKINQNHRSCSGSLRRGENFDLLGACGTKVSPHRTYTHGTKELRQPEFEHKNPFRSRKFNFPGRSCVNIP